MNDLHPGIMAAIQSCGPQEFRYELHLFNIAGKYRGFVRYNIPGKDSGTVSANSEDALIQRLLDLAYLDPLLEADLFETVKHYGTVRQS